MNFEVLNTEMFCKNNIYVVGYVLCKLYYKIGLIDFLVTKKHNKYNILK